MITAFGNAGRNQGASPAPEVSFTAPDGGQHHRANDVKIAQVPRDQPYKLRDYKMQDLDNYHLNFGHRLRATTASA